MKVEFVVLGNPQSKQRPRFARVGNFVRSYTPDETVQYETLVRLSYQQAGHGKLSGAIRAIIKAYFSIPKSVSKKRHGLMAENKILPITVSKDSDNICKIVLDSLNKIAYDDDRQVVEIHVYKLYAENPRVEVTLEEMEELTQ